MVMTATHPSSSSPAAVVLAVGGESGRDRALALLARLRPAWHDFAACRGSDVDFTALRSASMRAAAVAVCDRCPVREPCLEWAIELDDRVAILGGLDPTERRQIAERTHNLYERNHP